MNGCLIDWTWFRIASVESRRCCAFIYESLKIKKMVYFKLYLGHSGFIVWECHTIQSMRWKISEERQRELVFLSICHVKYIPFCNFNWRTQASWNFYITHLILKSLSVSFVTKRTLSLAFFLLELDTVPQILPISS